MTHFDCLCLVWVILNNSYQIYCSENNKKDFLLNFRSNWCVTFDFHYSSLNNGENPWKNVGRTVYLRVLWKIDFVFFVVTLFKITAVTWNFYRNIIIIFAFFKRGIIFSILLCFLELLINILNFRICLVFFVWIKYFWLLKKARKFATEFIIGCTLCVMLFLFIFYKCLKKFIFLRNS